MWVRLRQHEKMLIPCVYALHAIVMAEVLVRLYSDLTVTYVPRFVVGMLLIFHDWTLEATNAPLLQHLH